MSPGTYLRLCREAAGLSLDDVAARFATEPRYARHVRADHLEKIEADITPVSVMTVIVLGAIYPVDMRRLLALSAAQLAAAQQAARGELLIVTVVE